MLVPTTPKGVWDESRSYRNFKLGAMPERNRNVDLNRGKLRHRRSKVRKGSFCVVTPSHYTRPEPGTKQSSQDQKSEAKARADLSGPSLGEEGPALSQHRPNAGARLHQDPAGVAAVSYFIAWNA